MSPAQHRYDYPRPMASGDCCLFTLDGRVLKVLLVLRGKQPYEGCWALPGGFIELDEDLVDTATRELEEETGLTGIDLSFLGVYGKPGRDPRGRVITTVFTGVVPAGETPVRAGDDAADAVWHRAWSPPPLAFDHSRVLKDGLARLRRDVVSGDGAFRFLPARFSLDELRQVFEAVLRKRIEGPAFAQVMARTGVLKDAPGSRKRLCRKTLARRQREAALFRFD